MADLKQYDPLSNHTTFRATSATAPQRGDTLSKFKWQPHIDSVRGSNRLLYSGFRVLISLGAAWLVGVQAEANAEANEGPTNAEANFDQDMHLLSLPLSSATPTSEIDEIMNPRISQVDSGAHPQNHHLETQIARYATIRTRSELQGQSLMHSNLCSILRLVRLCFRPCLY